MTREQEAARGDRARRILEDELYQESFATVRAHLMRKWEDSKPEQAAEREALFMQMKLLDKLKATLTYCLETGKVAIFKLEVEKKRGTR